MANLACELFGLLFPDRYLRVRYEDLIHAPLDVIERMLIRVSLEAPPSLENAGAGDNRHQLYGNAMRFKPLSPSDLKEDVAWKMALPKGYRRLIVGICWPLSSCYQYSLRRRRPDGQ
jgi:hypothetical protein